MNVKITVPRSIEEYEEYMRDSQQKQFPTGTTELMMAAAYGDVFNVRRLAKTQAKCVNDAGNTALIYACSNGSVECIQLLLKQEDIRHRNKLGLSGVDCAFRARRMEACGILEHFCIEHGYNDLKPRITTTKTQERAAVDALRSAYDLDAELLFEDREPSQKKPGRQQFCSGCGGRMADTDKYCANCGFARK